MTHTAGNEENGMARAENARREEVMKEALREGRRAIGSHHAPDDCYATGPMTGDAYRDLVQCPACSFIAMYDAVITKADAGVAGLPEAKRSTSDSNSVRAELVEALEGAQAFIGVMFGQGPDAIIPESVPTPLGIAVKLGAVMAKVDAALKAAEGSPTSERDGLDVLRERMTRLADNELAEAQEALLIIQAALLHRQQPQDVTFHRGLKALRDARDVITKATSERPLIPQSEDL